MNCKKGKKNPCALVYWLFDQIVTEIIDFWQIKTIYQDKVFVSDNFITSLLKWKLFYHHNFIP